MPETSMISFPGKVLVHKRKQSQAHTMAAAAAAMLPNPAEFATRTHIQICAGRVDVQQDPRYYSFPGFGPIGTAWGCLLLGIALGCMSTIAYLGWTGQIKRNATIGFINNFGQIPKQLFKKPHPAKRSISEENSATAKNMQSTSQELSLLGSELNKLTERFKIA